VLAEAFASAPEMAEDCVDTLIAELVSEEATDDVAVLAMRA
jgi:hypothetical protein